MFDARRELSEAGAEPAGGGESTTRTRVHGLVLVWKSLEKTHRSASTMVVRVLRIVNNIEQ